MQAHASPCKPISRDWLRHFCLAILTCSVFLLCIAATGCHQEHSQSDVVSASGNESIVFQGGYIAADREHLVGFDIAPLNIPADQRVQEVQSSCECVTAKQISIVSHGINKPVLLVTVHPDSNLTGKASLAVELRINLSNHQKRSIVFEFVHYNKGAAIVE